MGKAVRILLVVGALFSAFGMWNAAADETSASDKLRILYSNRLTFTDAGTPLMTVEIMSGQSQVRISAERGMVVRPDGVGGSEVHGGSRWTVSLERGRAGEIREWTVVEQLRPSDPGYQEELAQALERWTSRGFLPRQFELGAVFGVSGAVIDSRQTAIAVSPLSAPQGAREAAAIARKFEVETRIHRELLRRPHGTMVARGANATVRNPSVIWFAPAKAGDLLVVEDVVTGGGGSQLTTSRETRRYDGSIYVTVGSDGKMTVVNAVPADKLLEGLVPAEMYPDAPDAALEAQAIAARTELLNKIGARHLTDPYMLCSSQHCQVYAGAGHEHPRTSRAVKKTRGRVLARHSGGLVDARYSATCGGHSEHNHHVWNTEPDPVLRGHLDSSSPAVQARFRKGISEDNIRDFLKLPDDAAYCGTTRYSKGRYRWTRRLEVAELTRRVAEHYPEVGRVLALEPLRRGVSGRVTVMRIRGQGGSAVAKGELHIRRLLGGLRSTLFTVETVGSAKAPSAFELRGAGFGHGVGMCQLGAIGMAQQGIEHDAILEHYYPGSRVQRLY
ncbi:SpoIID/LytB domain-containing protein [Haliangium ochraceum]|uniref:SpoIID/LytB domain protein n=1 Tax=Haliangium ochraceum (strain DSM 14365 / JCM 11303 / SMP-2) TaxID=502025 RepID=D0LU50_HALO1|nr:SpoIID/LytB domain-containing protein [Haliangium ochraceum]ACY17414.1 SpoIID/LytB domain protein [Haliangium ochraceum DSM 14365]